MHNPMLVQHPDHLRDRPGRPLAVVTARHDSVEQFPALAELHDEVHGLGKPLVDFAAARLLEDRAELDRRIEREQPEEPAERHRRSVAVGEDEIEEIWQITMKLPLWSFIIN